MTLNLSTYEALPLSAPERPEVRRSPAVAAGLSFLFPGLGHLYLGMKRNGLWLIVFEVLSLLALYGGSGTLYSQAILTAPTLYLFAIADAYSGAREWNAGVQSWMTGANPRIAAVLNLLTKGFGYFYLGDRMKGIVVFLVLTGVQSALLVHTNVWTSIFAITLQIGVAADAYRVGREKLLEHCPELRPQTNAEGESVNLIEEANPGGLKPSVVMGSFALLVTCFLIGYATLRALNGHAVASSVTLETGPEGLVCRVPKEHIEITVPENWQSIPNREMIAVLAGDDASLVAQEQYAIYTVKSMLEKTREEMRTQHPDAVFTPVRTMLGGRAAEGFEITFANQRGVKLTQRVLGRRRGLKIFTLVETWASNESRPVLDGIEKKFIL